MWAKSEHWLTLRNTITREVKEAFDAAGIEIPFPQRTLQPADVPLSVRLVPPGAGADGAATAPPATVRPTPAPPPTGRAGDGALGARPS